MGAQRQGAWRPAVVGNSRVLVAALPGFMLACLMMAGCSGLPGRGGALVATGGYNPITKSPRGVVVAANCWSGQSLVPCHPSKVEVTQHENGEVETVLMEFKIEGAPDEP